MRFYIAREELEIERQWWIADFRGNILRQWWQSSCWSNHLKHPVMSIQLSGFRSVVRPHKPGAYPALPLLGSAKQPRSSGLGLGLGGNSRGSESKQVSLFRKGRFRLIWRREQPTGAGRSKPWIRFLKLTKSKFFHPFVLISLFLKKKPGTESEYQTKSVYDEAKKKFILC